MNAIDIKNLIVEFDIVDSDEVVRSKKRVLDNLSLSISDGDFVCILGKNGSGKSTLAKCINSLILPTSGDIIIYGMNTKDESNILNIRQNVGMTFQNPDNQIVASIVEEDIAFGLENLGVDTITMNERIESAMKSLSIEGLKKFMVSKLSGGQKQKVSIAGILAMRPKIIVLDEPTSMIDKNGRIDLLNTIKKLNEEYSITIILISHYVEEIMYARRVVLIDKGKIILDDSPKEFLLKRDVLYNAGIDLPYITSLASQLSERGKKLKGNEIEVSELCEYLK